MGFFKYTKEYLARNPKRKAYVELRHGVRNAEKRIWINVKAWFYGVVTTIASILYIQFHHQWYYFAALHPLAALGAYIIISAAITTLIMYVILKHFIPRWNAYWEACNVRENIERILKEYDENNNDEKTFEAFKHLADADYNTPEIEKRWKAINNIYIETSKKIGVNPEELKDLSENNAHYKNARAFLHYAHELYFDNKFELEAVCSPEEIDELFELFSNFTSEGIPYDYKIGMQKGVLFDVTLPEDSKLDKAKERSKWYSKLSKVRLKDLGLIDGSTKNALSPKQLILLTKLALNELHVANAVSKDRFAEVLNFEGTGLSAQTINRAIAYRNALFEPTDTPRHEILGKIFFGTDDPLHSNDLQFIYSVMDKVHRGKLHWFKNTNETYCSESYINLIDGFKPKKVFRMDDSLETYINVIQQVDAMVPAITNINANFHQQNFKHAEDLSHEKINAAEEYHHEEVKRAPIYEDEIKDEDDEHEGMGRRG